MVDGKKTKSHLIITNTLARLANYGDVIAFVMNAIENVKPIIEIKKVRISGSTQLVPSLISTRRQETLAIRWIVEAAIQRRKAKQSLNLEQCLFAEIVDASNKIGVVRKKRDELHKLAEANRGFAHYRWW
uniref:ribosomal protein S7 n=1 Tax=Zygnema cf. cylindricum TaxID=3142258 RepID=UPI0031F3F958